MLADTGLCLMPITFVVMVVSRVSFNYNVIILICPRGEKAAARLTLRPLQAQGLAIMPAEN